MRSTRDAESSESSSRRSSTRAQTAAKSVTMADKSNVQRFGGDLWQRVFKEIAAGYPEITANHQYVDAMAMHMVLDPSQYQVIVSNNLFGDILTDSARQFRADSGSLLQATFIQGKCPCFEPVHGSAPPLAGKGIANPIGSILTLAMMLEYLGFQKLRDEVEEAVRTAVSANETTRDFGGELSTEQAGAAIIARLGQQ